MEQEPKPEKMLENVPESKKEEKKSMFTEEEREAIYKDDEDQEDLSYDWQKIHNK